MSDILVVIPTYDEAANVERVVRAVRGANPRVDVLVVDDNSPDGTGALADQLALHDPHVKVLHRTAKDGLGAAYRAGFRWGLDRDYSVLAQMDADCSHRPEQLQGLLSALAPSVDVVLGSRWVPGGEVVGWSIRRELLSRGGNSYVRLMLGLDVGDATGGFRAYRRTTLEVIDLEEVQSQGYCFQVDMLRRTLAVGATVVEVPIRFVEREHGKSKMSIGIVAEALWRVTLWGLEKQLRSDDARRGLPQLMAQETDRRLTALHHSR